MKKKKEISVVLIVIFLLILFIIVRVIMDKKEKSEGIKVGATDITMYIKHKDGTKEEIEAAPKEGDYEIESECGTAKITWNNETHELTMSLKSTPEVCTIYFNEK